MKYVKFSFINSTNKLKLKNDYYSALKLYEQALSLNKNIDLMYEIGSIHRSLGDSKKLGNSSLK